MKNSNDPMWLAAVARVEVIIERYGICNAVAAVLQAIENMEEEMIGENIEFEGSQHHKNIEHQKRVLEFAMGAVDLDSRYGNSEARLIAMESFKHNIEEALEHHG